MTSSCRFTSSQSRGHDAGGQPRAKAAPPLEAYSDRNEESCLLCVTARDDAFAPTGILRAARDLRANRSVGGAIPMYSRSSNADRRTSLYKPGVSHGQHPSWSRKFLVVISLLTAPKSALGNRTIVVTCRVKTLTELPNCKLSPRGNKPAGQALSLRQMIIKSAIPARTFQIYTEYIASLLRIPLFIVTVQLRLHAEEVS
jgi:hypothetical protein